MVKMIAHSNKKFLLLSTIILPVILGVLFLYYYKAGTRRATDIGLGKGTATFTPLENKIPIHITNPELSVKMKSGWVNRGKHDVYLWMGNSQLHGINKYQQGQTNSVGYLFRQLERDSQEVLGVSYPNANMQEFLVSAIYFSKLFPLKGILLPVFYDDMREDGIRDILRTGAVTDSIKHEHSYYSSIASINSLKSIPGPDKVSTGNNDFSGISETLQDNSERYLDKKLEQNWSLWKSRPDIRGNIFNDIYNFRNKVFGITASTKRAMIPGRYEDNFKSFTSIIAYCKDKKIPLFIYIPPIRNDAPLPYDLKAYADFKSKVEEVCVANNISFINLETIVPAKFWSIDRHDDILNKKTDLDFMHFQENGHKLLADTIYKFLKDQQSK